MNNFNELQSSWKNQPDIRPTEQGFQSLLNRARTIKRKQYVTNAVLGSTIGILVVFFFYLAGYGNQQVVLGISMMVGSLLLRILLEVYSIRNLGKIDMLSDQVDFKKKIIGYYRNRKWVHFLWTPLVMGGYIVGFLVLLPLFKANLSAGFYTYIQVSSIVLLLFFSIFIGNQAHKELRELQRLKED